MKIKSDKSDIDWTQQANYVLFFLFSWQKNVHGLVGWFVVVLFFFEYCYYYSSYHHHYHQHQHIDKFKKKTKRNKTKQKYKSGYHHHEWTSEWVWGENLIYPKQPIQSWLHDQCVCVCGIKWCDDDTSSHFVCVEHQ